MLNLENYIYKKLIEYEYYQKSGKVKVWHIVIILLLVLVAYIINRLLFLPFPKTPPDLWNKEWLSFWGSFLGGSSWGNSDIDSSLH